LRVRIRPWLRRLISRSLAIVPAVFVIALRGESAADDLLVLSQVVLSLQLAFAVVPLIHFTSDRRKMGGFANPPWVVTLAALAALVIVGLNATLVVQQVGAWIVAAGPNALLLRLTLVPAIGAAGLLLLYLTLAPLLARRWPAIAAHAPEAVPARLPAPGSAPALPLPAGVRRVALALELGPADR